MASATVTRSAATFVFCGGLGSQAWLFYRQPCWRCAVTLAAPASSTPAAGPRKVYIVGGGVAAAATAYALARRGEEVVVLCQALCESGCSSNAAAGGMSKEHGFKGPEAWVAMAKQLLPWHSGYRFFGVGWADVMCDPFFIRWLWRYASESLFSSKAHRERKTKSFAPLVAWCVDQTVACADAVPSLRADSSMRDDGAFGVLKGLGYGFSATSTLSDDEARTMEPQLPRVEGAAVTMIPGHMFADCGAFTRALWAHLRENGASLREGAQVLGFSRNGRCITGIQTSQGHLSLGGGDQVVLCAGAWTGPLCDMMDVFVPIYPCSGYSIDVPVSKAVAFPKHLIFTAACYAVPQGDTWRIASVARLAGWSTTPHPVVEQSFREEASSLFPQYANHIAEAPLVVGLRPLAADELPVIGQEPRIDNLHLNVGPGHSGWKCCIGFGEILARGMLGEEMPPIEGVELVSPRGRTGRALTGTAFFRTLRQAFRPLAQ